MTFEVLIATMNQTDYSLLDRMGIESNAIVCNQKAPQTSYEVFEHKGHTIRWYNFEEQGVGLNRNNALLRSTSDICLLADDDVTFVKGYQDIILKEFKETPKADVLLFNIYDTIDGGRVVVSKKRRIGRLRSGRFGAVRIAFRRLPVIKNRISFSILFGGGALFSAGEDSQFLFDCCSKGLKLYAVKPYILKLNDGVKSSWFKGYNDKFFHDMGVSWYVGYGNFAKFFVIIQLFRHRKDFLKEFSFSRAYKDATEGIKEYARMR